MHKLHLKKKEAVRRICHYKKGKKSKKTENMLDFDGLCRYFSP